MDIDDLVINTEGEISGKGSDDAGVWSIKGQIDIDSLDEQGMMKVTFDKVYPSWVIYYTGQINLLRSKMSGHWGFQPGDDQAKFTIEMQDDAKVNIVLSEVKGDKKEEMYDFECELDFEKFMFHISGGDEEVKDMKLSSLELSDYSILHYQINNVQTHFATFEGQGVVIAEFIAKGVANNDFYAKGYAQATQQIYFVEEDNPKLARDKPSKSTPLMYLTNAGVMRAQNNRDKQLLVPMPGTFNKDNKYIGAILYAQMGTNNLVMNFVSCQLSEDPLKNKKSWPLDFPMQPYNPSFIVDYPLCAYNTFYNGGNEIHLFNMALNEPQKIINCMDWKFVCFVKHNFQTEQAYFDKEQEYNRNIMVLMQHNTSYRLLTFKESPWLHHDQETPFKYRDEQPDFVYKGDVFIQSGEVTSFHDFLEVKEDEEIKGMGGLTFKK